MAHCRSGCVCSAPQLPGCQLGLGQLRGCWRALCCVLLLPLVQLALLGLLAEHGPPKLAEPQWLVMLPAEPVLQLREGTHPCKPPAHPSLLAPTPAPGQP